MKKLWILIAFLAVLTACRASVVTGGNLDGSASQSIQNTQAGSGMVKTAADGSVMIDADHVSRMSVKDIPAGDQKDYSEADLIKEFCILLENQKYTGIEKMPGESYRVEFFDSDEKIILKAAFHDNTVYFDRKITIGKTVLEKGSYEVGPWSWASFSFYLNQLNNTGMVMDPENIRYPAKIKIPDEHYTLQLIDQGDERINKYDVYPMLYDMMKTSFSGREFEIVGSKKFYDYEAFEAETDSARKEKQCISVTFITSDTRLVIRSQSSYNAFAMGYCLTLAKIPGEMGMYELFTDRMIFRLRAGSDFDARFEALFAENGKTYKAAAPEEIRSLFDGKKPYYMEYICKNLGIGEWTGSEPDRLEIKKMKLNSQSDPYTVVHIYNPFDLRMLIYKHNEDNTLSFAGDIRFGGRVAGTEYRLEKAGDRIWIAGNRCRGYGTGISLYYREWYLVTDSGVHLALSYPYSTHEDGPYGGYALNASKVTLQKTEGLKIKVNYDVVRRYHIFLSIADEYGTVELEGSKTAEFEWDEKQEKFVSSYAVDETGAFDIPADCPEIAQKRDALLNEYYEQLLDNIASLAQDSKERDWKAQGIKSFLEDCTDSVKKVELLKKLAEISVEM